jgi:RHS repeat-associated protein
MQMTGGYAPAVNPNKKLYNAGSEWQDDIEGLADYYSTFFREYDPVIGRFNGVDPKSESFESWTTYHYSYNNPVNFNDPMGDYAAQTERGKYFERVLEYVAFWGIGGLGNSVATYSGDDANGDGGGGSISSLNFDNPIALAVFGLHQTWGVKVSSVGGADGFNKVVNNVISGGGATMNFIDNPFYDLTAGETVREQVKENNFDDARTTILSAYKDVLNFNNGDGWKMELAWSDGAGHHRTDPFYSQKLIKITTDKDFFRNFASNSTRYPTSFGLLVRSIYHEFIHGWDFAGIKGNEQLAQFHSTIEFRAHYLMASNNNGRLPNMTSDEKKMYWGAVFTYYDNRGSLHNLYRELMADPTLSNDKKKIYTSWANEMSKYSGKRK